MVDFWKIPGQLKVNDDLRWPAKTKMVGFWKIPGPLKVNYELRWPTKTKMVDLENPGSAGTQIHVSKRNAPVTVTK